MSKHQVILNWKRQGAPFTYKEYPRAHTWDFGTGELVKASAAPDFLGDPLLADPEQAFVASLASCHALTFLALCSLQKITVNSYCDTAIGYLEKAEDGKPWLSRVELNPSIKFDESEKCDPANIKDIHQKAHLECFLARSVKTQITIN
ncbi:MAG: OsmC family peroxiredoxin [Akkermansiaceae bacterium]|jgi:organic hydroperoxide reductase OsmC/OhrA|nr:OsmC family peroxiredoxin [Akkermansiaceae bacterium]MDG1854801.1 OsmC family protein [Verrucomicrobiales bacterium]